MPFSDFLGYLTPQRPTQVGRPDARLSLWPSREVEVLRPEQLRSSDQSIAESTFFAILSGIQNIVSFVSTGVYKEGKHAYTYFSNHYYSYKLRKAVERIFQVFRSTSTPVADFEPSAGVRRLIGELQTDACEGFGNAFLSDHTRLKELSHLRKAPRSPVGDPEVFEALFHGRGNYQSRALPKVVEFVKGFLPQERLDLHCLDEAIQRDNHLKKLIETGKKEQPAERKEKLKRLAESMAKQAQKLAVGESFMALGGVYNQGASSCPLTEGLMKDFLPEDLHQILSGKEVDEVAERLTQKLVSQFWDSKSSGQTVSQIQSGIKQALSKAQAGAEFILPKVLYDHMANSLKQDLEEIFFGFPTEEGVERVGEKLWIQLKEKGIEKAFQETLLEMLQKSRQVVDARVEKVGEEVLARLPLAARPMLDIFGLPKGEEESVWVEIEKQRNGQLKLTLFARGTAAEPHPNGETEEKKGVHLPLIYSNIDPSKLDTSFFYTLLASQTLPHWDSDVRFSIQNLHDGLLDSLERPPDAPTLATLEPLETLQGEGVWNYVTLYLRYHLQMEAEEFEHKYGFQMRLEALIQMWSHVQADPSYLDNHPLIAERLKAATSELSDRGAKLYQAGKLSEDALKALYATVWEAERHLLIEKPLPNTASSVVVPPDLQNMVKQLVLSVGISPSQISQIKEALMVFYGSDIEEVVDQAFRDILPTLTTDEMNEARSKRSSEGLYTWEGMKRACQKLRHFRFSFLHFIRLYIAYSKVVSDIFRVTLASQLIAFIIMTYCPALMTYTTLSLTTVSQLLACFGPSVLKPILPDPIYQSVRSLFRLATEVINYVQRRLMFVIIRIIVRILIGGETATKLSGRARSWSQRVTRSGELSYLIPYGKNEVGQMRLKPQEQSSGFTQASVKKRDASSEMLPRPYTTLLTKTNLKAELMRWNLEAARLIQGQESLRTDAQRKSQMLLYVNHQVRNLSLPGKTDLWDQVDPLETMKLLKDLMAHVSQAQGQQQSHDEKVELVTSYYSVYAIMDHLARRLNSAEIPEDLQANGCDFVLWLQSPGMRVTNPKTLSQIKEILAYFGFDFDREYTEAEIDARRDDCLFNYRGLGKRFYQPAFASISNGSIVPTYRGLRHTKDGAYYRRLLKHSVVRECLEGCGLKRDASEWHQFLTLFENPRGTKGHPLPTAFAYLREIDFASRNCLGRESVLNSEVSIQRSDPTSYWWIPKRLLKVGRVMKSGMHFITLDHFRRQDFDAKGVRLGSDHSVQSLLERRFSRRGHEHRLGEEKRCSIREEAQLFDPKRRRTVNQIFATDPLDLKDLPPQERRLIEMINHEKSDQVMLALGYFMRNMGRLQEPRFRFLLDLFFTRIGALEAQLQENPETISAIGRFFQAALDQFEQQEEVETCLYLTKIGQEFCHSVGEHPEGTFPDFCAFLRYRLIPYLRTLPADKRVCKVEGDPQDLLLMSYHHLIFSYRLQEPSMEKKQILEDIGRLTYTMLDHPIALHEASQPDVQIKAEEVLYLWEPYVTKAMKQDPAVRKAVIEHILRDMGMESVVDKEDTWSGSYPLFSNGKITLDVMLKTQHTHEITTQIATNRVSAIVPKPGRCRRLSARAFSFPDQGILVEFAEGTFENETPMTLHRQFDGAHYEYLPEERLELIQGGKSFSLKEGETLYLERSRLGRSRHLLCRNGERTLWKRKVHSVHDPQGHSLFDVRWDRKEMEGISVRKVNFEEEPHDLSLLSWFADPSEIKIYAYCQKPDQVAFIEMPKWKLRFQVKEQGGHLEALSIGRDIGYFLSKTQRDEKLLKYGKYLLMENLRGEKKVHIVTKSLKTMMADFVLHRLGKIQTSPLIERYLVALTEQLGQETSQLLTYDLDEQGHLKTSDPLGIAYLSLFHFINGNREESLHYFSELETYGRKHPYPEDIYRIFDLMYLPLLCAQDRFSRELALRLGAIQSENQLIQHREETKHSVVRKKETETIKILKWILLQKKYAESLEARKEGEPEILNDFQELFLLKELSQMNEEYYRKRIGKQLPDTLRSLADRVGLENLANTFLFAPSVMERYHQLRLQLENGSAFSGITRGMAIQAIQNVFGGEEEAKQGAQKGALSQLIHTINRVKNSHLFQTTIGYTKASHYYEDVELSPHLEDVPTTLWGLDQKTLKHFFPYYYRLAKNEPPRGVNPFRFRQKREELVRSLKLMQGHYSSEEKRQRDILLIVSKGGRFPTARRLEDAIQGIHTASADERYEKVYAFETFLSTELLRSCSVAQASQVLVSRDTALCVARGCQAVAKKVSSILIHVPIRVFKWFGTGLGLYHTVRHDLSRDRELSETVTSRSRSELQEKPLEHTLALLLKQKDGAINRAMDSVFDEFFLAEEKPLPIDPTPVESYEAGEGETLLKKALDDVHQNLQDYYKRPREMQLHVQLKAGKDPQKFLKKVRELHVSLMTFLKSEEKAIEKLASRGNIHQFEDAGTQIVKAMQANQRGSQAISFNALYGLFTHCDDEALKRKAKIHPAAWEEIKARLYLYQTVRRRFNLLSSQLKPGDSPDVLAIARELKRRPAYDLGKDVPEIVLRAKLSYEVALEFMLYQVALQSKQLDRLLLSHFEDAKRVVLEQIMGTGKTFLMALSDRVFADGKNLVVNVAIDPVAPSNFNMFINYCKKAFGQVGSIFRFNRSMLWTTEQLAALKQLLKRVLYMGEHLNARQKDLQAFELRFLEEGLDKNGDFEKSYGSKSWKERLGHYKDALRLLRKQGIENSDEKHKLDDPTSGILNFPLGKALTLRDEEVSIMNEVMLTLLTTPAFREYITIKAKRPEKLPKAVYEAKIKDVLAEKIADLEMLDIKPDQRKQFVQYLKGEARSIPRFVLNSSQRRAIGQAKGLVTVLLSFCLDNVINVDFTVSKKKGNGEYARPAEGNDNPLENSTILKPDEAYIKTLMRLFQTRLNEDQLEKLIAYLKGAAEAEKEKTGQPIQKTEAGRFFALHCPGYQIDTYQPVDLPKIFNLLNASDRAITMYARHFIASEIKFYRQFLSSNPINGHAMFHQDRSRTGTPKNKACYPVGTDILSHPGTEGESIHVLEKKIGEASIHMLEQSDPRLALREIIYRFFHVNPKLTALIDLDPICNNLSPEMINAEFQDYLMKHRPEMQGVVFYDKEKNLVVAKKGASTTIPFEESSIPKDKRISIFDHTHTTASDIPQADDAEAILTIGENVTVTNLAQAFDRMRQARRGEQKVTVVMTKKAQEIIGEGRIPTMRDIIKRAVKNEIELLAEHHFISDRYKLQNVLRRAILDKILDAPTIEKSIAIIREFEDFLVLSAHDDPFENYGYIDVMRDPHTVIEDYRRTLLARARRSSHFSRNDINQMRDKMKRVGENTVYPEHGVHVYQTTDGTQENDIFLGQQAHQSQEASIDQEQHVDTNIHVNVNQTSITSNTPSVPISHTVHTGWSWPDNLDPTDVDSYFHVTTPNAWFLPRPVPIYAMGSYISRNPELTFLSSAVSKRLFVSENFAQQRDNRLLGANAIKPCGFRQPPLYNALVIQDNRGEKPAQRIMLLHPDEVPFWRKKLAEDWAKTAHPSNIKVGLYDFVAQTIVASGGNTLTTAELHRDGMFHRASAQVKFLCGLSGDHCYSPEEEQALQPWIESNNSKQMRRAFEKIHKERGIGAFSGSRLENLFFDATHVHPDMRIRGVTQGRTYIRA